MTEEVQDNQEAPVQAEVPEKFQNDDGTVNQDALIKSYTDLEKNRSQVVTEVDQLKKELDAVKEQSKMAETLETIANNTAPVEKEEQSYEDYLKLQAEEMGLEADDPAVKLNSLSAKAYDSWLKQTEKALEEKYDKKLDAIRAEFQEDKASRVKSSAAYTANKAEIDEMVEAGFDEGKAIQFVLNKAAQTSDTSEAPASMPSGRVTATPTESEYWSSPEERAQFVVMHGEEATKEVEAVGLARLKRTAGEVA